MGATTLSVSSRALLAACARLGLDTEQILRAVKLEPAIVQDPDARIPLEQVAALWHQAYELSNDPNLALHAAEVLPFGSYRVLDYLISSAPTIGTALVKVSKYFPLVNNAARLTCDVGESEVAVGVAAPAEPAVVSRPYAEFTMAACFLHTRTSTSPPFQLIRVEFSHARPPDIREHERIFECPVHFEAASCRMMIAREVWDAPRTHSNPTLFTALDTHARMLLGQRPDREHLIGRVREAIEVELRGGNPKLESIARQLAMSPRTLQRRLKEQGVLFNEVLDEIRFRAAKAYLAQADVAGAEVAYLLGFAEQSSFHRAFKRWSSQTPAEYRRRISAE